MVEAVAFHYGVLPSQLLDQTPENYHLDMAFGMKAIQERDRAMARKSGEDDTWRSIVSAVYVALKGSR